MCSWSDTRRRVLSSPALLGFALLALTRISWSEPPAPNPDHRNECISHISGLQTSFVDSKRWLKLFTTGGALASLIAGVLAAAANDKSRWRRFAAAIAAFGGGVVAIPKAAFDDP